MLPSTESDNIAEAAQRLWNARRSNLPCAPVHTLLAAGDVEAAYEVMTVPVAVLRSGNIVTDLMFKVPRQFDA